MKTIKTKFGIGDIVYFRYNYWFFKAKVKKVSVQTFLDENNEEVTETQCSFLVNIRDRVDKLSDVCVCEKDCYATIEGLKNKIEIIVCE